MPHDEKAKRIAKLRAILAKASPSSGCTEAEALAAASKARLLMEQYSITTEDLATSGEKCVDHRCEPIKRYSRIDIAAMLSVNVGRFCSCRVYRDREKRLHYFGLPSSTIFAEWLLNTLVDHIKNHASVYALAGPGGYDDERSYIVGAISSINERLKQAILEQERALHEAPTGSDNALLVIRNNLVESEYDDLRRRLGLVRSKAQKPRFGNSSAYGAGRDAGNRASFARPIEGDKSTRLIK